MSQFNQPFGAPGQPPLAGKPGPVQYESYPTPPPKSSGTNVVLVVLGLVFGLLLMVVLACGILGFMVTRAVTSMTSEFQTFFQQEIANQVVETYAEHPQMVEHIGTIRDFEFQDAGGFEMLNKPILRLRVEGDKGQGTVVLYRRGNRQQKVTLEVDGQEFLLDDNPRDFIDDDSFQFEGNRWQRSDGNFESIPNESTDMGASDTGASDTQSSDTGSEDTESSFD